MLAWKTTEALKFLKRIVPPHFHRVIDEAIAAIEWRKAHGASYKELDHDA